MMGTEQASETHDFSPQVTRLIAREQFSERVHRENFQVLPVCVARLFVAFACDGELL